MARIALGVLIGLGVGVVVGAALGIRAQEQPTDDTVAAAAEAGVDALDLQGAVNTTGLEPRAYLIAVGELTSPSPPTLGRPPLPGVVDAGGGANHPAAGTATLAYIAAHSRYGRRASCVAQIESRGGLAMWNPTPWGRFGEHAQSYFGWLPSTYRTVADGPLGNLDAEIRAFDRMLDRGRGREFAGIAAGRC